MNALTEWYPPHVKPVRVGWYERQWKMKGSAATPDYWDGKRWFIGYGHPTGMAATISQNIHWRGLAADPVVTK